MSYATGIDISDNNGTFDWEPWGGIDFAFIKATEVTPNGLYLDSQFEANWKTAWDRYQGKLVRIAYAFGHPGEAVGAQVKALRDRAGDHLRPGDHFMLDLEVTDGLKPAEVAKFGQAFCHEMNRAAPHHRCIVYTFPAFAADGSCDGLGPWRLYIAEWGVQQPSVPAPWKAWWFWQFEQGASGQPDRDVFNGDRALLEQFAWMPPERRR